MEFRFRAREDLRSSLLAPASASASASDAYFSSQALRGLFGAGGGDAGRVDLATHPFPGRDSLQLDLQRERIREEIRARETAQTRILEEEVRRELEFERAMAARRHNAERFTLLQEAPLHPSERGLHFIQEARAGERQWPGGPVPVPHRPEFGFDERLPFPLEDRVGDRLGPPLVLHRPEVGFNERLRLPLEARLGERLGPHRPQVGFDERLSLPLEARLGERLGPGLLPHRPQAEFDERLLPLEARLGERLGPGLLPHRPQAEFDERLLPLEARLGERLGPGLLPHRPQAEFDERLRLPPVARLRERLGPGTVPHRPQAEFDEPLRDTPQPKRMLKRKPPVPRRNPEYIEIDTSRPNLSGTKRKAAIPAVEAVALPRPDKKRWGCALCQVNTTGELGLKEHLQGKKHKAKEEELLSTKGPAVKKLAGSAPPAKLADKPLMAKAGPTNDPAKKNTSEGKQKQKVDAPEGKQKQKVDASEGKREFWCEPCKLRCNSQSMLNSHLGGKRHKLQLEGPWKDKEANTSSAKPGSEKERKPVTTANPVARKARKQNKQAAKREEVKGEAAKKESDAPESTEAAAVESAKVATLVADRAW